MRRYEVVNAVVKKYGYQKYLEVGFAGGETFHRINCPDKESVDIRQHSGLTYCMSSDDFFKQNNKTYDIVFIDACHERSHVYRDINNSLKFLNENGTIVCHDMSPICKQAMSQTACGNAWMAWVDVRKERDDLEMFVVDTDCGCGVIRRGNNSFSFDKDLVETWEFLEENRIEMLNLISLEKFQEWLKQSSV